jgi:outer membrane protein OmpA-like peptidoglycan-associated protein
MKKMLAAMTALSLALVTLITSAPAQAAGIVITPSTLTPSFGDTVTVDISGLDPAKQYELILGVGHNLTFYGMFGGAFVNNSVAEVTPTGTGTFSWSGTFQPYWGEGTDLDAPVDDVGFLYMDAAWGLFPMRFGILEAGYDPNLIDSFDDFAGLSSQLYPSSQDGIGTLNYSGPGFVNGTFVAGQEVTVTGSGWGDIGTMGLVGATLVPKVDGETASLTFWRTFIEENSDFSDFFSLAAVDGEIDMSFTVPTLPSGEFALWIYYFSFDADAETLSIRQNRLAYELGYSVDYITAASADAPIFTDDTIALSATVGTAYSDSVAASGTGVTYSISAGTLPAGLSLNSSTGEITGTPTAAGEFTFTIKAENTDGSDLVEFTIVVSSVSNPPVFTDDTIALSATVGTAYSDSVAASGTGVTYSVDEGLLPYGLTLDSSTGAITGTPTAAGEYTVVIRAQNDAGSDYVEFTIVVSDPEEEVVFERVSRHQYVVLDGFPRWYSETKDVCHVAESNKVVFSNVGRCVVSTRDSGNSNSNRVFRVTGEKGESGDGRVNAFEVYFAKGSSVLDSKAISKLTNRAAKFKNHPVVVYGYSAGKKSPEKADRLANRRARVVAAFLEDKGVAVTMVRGVGSTFQNKKKSWKNKRALIQINRFAGK